MKITREILRNRFYTLCRKHKIPYTVAQAQKLGLNYRLNFIIKKKENFFEIQKLDLNEKDPYEFGSLSTEPSGDGMLVCFDNLEHNIKMAVSSIQTVYENIDARV